ncbi:hypothetical protein, partial [Massilia glaciei]|uniref:hypothetical protein n=1 Tax=Massilia glaciei TaxID=1524097 RepID=UPI001C634FC8
GHVRPKYALTDLESVFRSLKTDLGLRPVYHQVERRVEGHLFISVLAYHFVHTLRLQLTAEGFNDAWDNGRETLAGQNRITPPCNAATAEPYMSGRRPGPNRVRKKYSTSVTCHPIPVGHSA